MTTLLRPESRSKTPLTTAAAAFLAEGWNALAGYDHADVQAVLDIVGTSSMAPPWWTVSSERPR